MSNLKKALAILEAAGIDRVEVRFSGGGDSGQIDDVRYFCGEKDVLSEYVATRKSAYVDGKWEYVDVPAPKALDTVCVTVVSHMYDTEKNKYVEVSREEKQSPDAVIEAHVYAELDACGVDWYNNEGGQGTYTFTLKDGKWTYEFTVEVNYLEILTEHMAEGNVDEEGEE